MHHKYAVILLLLFASKVILAQQNFNKDYTPVVSSGTLPEEFCMSTQKKIEEDNKKIKEKRYDTKETTKDFNIEANYDLDEYLLSGEVLVNDKISKYLNQVAGVIAKSNPEVPKNLVFFATKNTEVNAFCFPRGYIFVSIALIAQAENEAELAYILAHEITHYTKKHSLNEYIEFKKLDRKKYIDEEEEASKVLKKYSYSREKESEADIEGFKLYQNTEYQPLQAYKSFDILQYSYLPFDEVELKRSSFEDSYYHFPPNYFLKETAVVKSDDNYDDTKSTHPNIRKRKQSIQPFLPNNSKKGETFIVSEADFYTLRETCRFELCRLYLKERDFINSFYATYIMLNKYPNNIYLHKNMAKVLYGLSLHKAGFIHTDRNILPSHENMEGKIQQAYYFLDQLPEKEMVLFAERQIWSSHKKFPKEPLFKEYSDSLMKMIVEREGMVIGDFHVKYADTVLANKVKQNLLDSAAKLSSSGSKYDKIKSDQIRSEVNKSEDETEAVKNYYQFAFSKLLSSDKEFKISLAECSAKYEPGRKDDSNSFKSYTVSSGASKSEKKRKKKKKIKKLGIDNIIVFNPYYFKYDERKKQNSYLIDSDQKQEEFVKTIKKIVARVKLECSLIDPGSYSTSDIDKFNDFATIQSWLEEKTDQGFNVDAPVFGTDDIKALVEKYKTRYCLITGIKSIREAKKTSRVIADIALCLLVYPIPYAIIDLARVEQTTMYFAVLLNLETGKVELVDETEISMKDSRDMLSTYLYDTMYKIKSH